MNILTFDIEEWFHILDNDITNSVDKWSSFESRIHKNMETIHMILSENNISATFFVVGWIAEKYPKLIKEISELGYEVGSHTHLHQLIYNQTPQIFKNDVEKSIKTIEDLTGNKVCSFRAPGFSITENNKWAFEVLFKLGIRRDSSIFPAGRNHGGFPSYKDSNPSILEYNNVSIKEFPINTHKILGFPIIFSGGGYFRLLPYSLIKFLSRNSKYVMTYFHPRDFDYDQPMIPGLSLKRKFQCYIGLKSCKKKLNKWLKDFDFIDLKNAENLIDWKNVNTIKL